MSQGAPLALRCPECGEEPRFCPACGGRCCPCYHDEDEKATYPTDRKRRKCATIVEHKHDERERKPKHDHEA